jgi:hypothetical protein
MGKSICPIGTVCFHDTMLWNGTLHGQMRDQSIPMAFRVSDYMMLRMFPPSISTLVRRFMPTIGSTKRGNLPGRGKCSGWS